MLWLLWLVIATVALVGEAVTTGLFLASVSLAAIAAAGLSTFAPLPVQLVSFGVLSVLLLFAVRPAVLRMLPLSGDVAPQTGPVGRQALAVERIDQRRGMIRFGNGEFWTARPLEADVVIEPGSDVEVVRMEGLTARVQPVSRSEGMRTAFGSDAGTGPERHAVSSGAATMAEPDTLVHAFLFADVRGYTRFTHEHGDEAGARLVEKFAAVARGAVEARGGRVVELRGDEILAVFASPRQALRAAVEVQARCAREMESDPSLPLAVGVGLDAGEAVALEGGYRGGALNVASRLCAMAQADEVLATEELAHLAGHMEDLLFAEQAPVDVKGIAQHVRVVQVKPRPV